MCYFEKALHSSKMCFVILAKSRSYLYIVCLVSYLMVMSRHHVPILKYQYFAAILNASNISLE